jgi:hypothetical protein
LNRFRTRFPTVNASSRFSPSNRLTNVATEKIAGFSPIRVLQNLITKILIPVGPSDTTVGRDHREETTSDISPVDRSAACSHPISTTFLTTSSPNFCSSLTSLEVVSSVLKLIEWRLGVTVDAGTHSGQRRGRRSVGWPTRRDPHPVRIKNAEQAHLTQDDHCNYDDFAYHCSNSLDNRELSWRA